MGRPPSIDRATEAAILAAYDAGASLAEAAAPFGRTARATTTILARHGRKPRSRSDGQAFRHARGRGVRRHALDARVFDRKMKAETAFWLGFFAVRGRVAEGYVEVETTPAEERLLHRLLRLLRSDAPISDHRNPASEKTQRRVRIVSTRLAASLAARRDQLDEAVPAPLRLSFWRGAFAGRGSVWTRATGPVASFTASETLMPRFLAWLSSRGLDVRARPRRSGPGTLHVEVAGKTGAAVVALLVEPVLGPKPSLAALVARYRT